MLYGIFNRNNTSRTVEALVPKRNPPIRTKKFFLPGGTDLASWSLTLKNDAFPDCKELLNSCTARPSAPSQTGVLQRMFVGSILGLRFPGRVLVQRHLAVAQRGQGLRNE